jgi:uncharacterized membrane protein
MATTTATTAPPRAVTRGRAARAALLLGVGLGGFLDGIVLHQILQWHHMLTSAGGHPASTVAGLETNTLWDGLFHLFAWLATLAGVVLLWRASRAGETLPGRALAGLILAGWGLFNLVEGIVDHQLLTIHHVRGGDDAWAYDLAYLVLGAALVAGGLLLARRARPRAGD